MAYNKLRVTFHAFPSEKSGNEDGVELIDTSQKLADGFDTRLHVFTNGWTTDSGQTDGSLQVKIMAGQVQMDGKGHWFDATSPSQRR